MKNNIKLDQYNLFFLVCFTLPMFMRINNIILGIFVIYSIMTSFNKTKVHWSGFLRQYYPLIFFFLLAIEASFSNDVGFNSFQNVEKYLSYIVIPLSLINVELDREKILSKALNGLLIGCIATLLLCYINAFYEILAYGEPLSYFLRWRHLSHRFTAIADTHPSYLGLFIVTSTYHVLYNLKEIKRGLKILLILFFFLGLLQLGGRVALFLYVLMISSYIFYFFKISFKQILFLTIPIVIFSTIFLTEGSYYFKERVFSLKTIKEDTRFERFKVSYEIFLNDPLLGADIDNIDERRISKYKENGDKIAAEKGYNAHNQLLEFLSLNGIIGGLFYIYIFVSLLIRSYKEGQNLFLFIFAVFFIANLTESMLVRVRGIEFLSIFLTLFLTRHIKSK